jgi:hypothetical protein
MNKYEVVKKIEHYPFSGVTEFDRQDFLKKTFIGNNFKDSFLVENRLNNGEIVIAKSYDEYDYNNISKKRVNFTLCSDNWMDIPGVSLGQLILIKGKISNINIINNFSDEFFFEVYINIIELEIINKPINYNPKKLIQQDIKEYESEIKNSKNKGKVILLFIILLIILFSIGQILNLLN